MENLDNNSHTITVNGEGQVLARPDVATLRLGVLSTAKSAQEAMAANAQLMENVLGKIRALGVPSEDLQTAGFNVSPIFEEDQKQPRYGQIVGYRVEDTLVVRADVGKAGRLLDEGVGAGANVASGISFGLRDEAPLRQRALKSAVAAARHDAEVVAKAMGVTLKSARTVEVTHGGSPVLERTAFRAATPIEAGQITISAGVRMVFQFRPSKE